MGAATRKEIPPGGTTGQVLAKASNADRDIDWSTVPGSGWGTITGNIEDQLDLSEKFSDYVNRGAEYYFTSVASDQGGGRLEMITEVPAGGGFGINNTGVVDLQVLAEFSSLLGYPGETHIPSGVMSVRLQARQPSGTRVTRLYAEFYTRTSPGGINTPIATTNLSEILTATNQEIKLDVVTTVVANLLATDRLCVRIRASVGPTGTAPEVTIDIQGTNRSRMSIPMTQVYLGTLLDGKQDIIDGTQGNNSILGTNNSGLVQSVPNLNSNPEGGITQTPTVMPDGESQTNQLNGNTIYIDPQQNSPNVTWNQFSNRVEFDPNSTGFSIGTNGQSFRFTVNNAYHVGTSDIGSIEFIQNNFQIGNGTDPIDFKGLAFMFGFGQIDDNVNITGPMQGYGMQFNVSPNATIDTNAYINGFFDYTNIGCATPNYISFVASPTIESINNNNNYIGFNVGPTIDTFTGNAGFIGVNINGNLGTFNENGYFQGVNVNPNITLARYAAGIQVSMDNVTVYAGVQSSLTEQDLTYTFNSAGDNNSYTLEYTTGATAGSEVVSVLGQAISIQIEDGVSTATQIKTAVDNSGLITVLTVTITGVGGDPQVAFGPDNFSGGVNPGTKLAAYLDGNVEITGGLTFGGSLSIGALNAFASQPLVNGGGTPSSIHSLITMPTVAANAVLTSGDTISVNTAALISIGDNATVGTSFIGVAALGLPAVLGMGTGSTLDRCYAALFALSLDPGATGGTVDEVGLCKALAIPNGTTTVNKLKGFLMDLPFGDPGTTSWGFYETSGIHNYFAGDLMIGGTAGSDDVVANDSVALEIKSVTKALLNARMTTTERDALTAIDGMVLYNSTTAKLQARAGGAWVDLH